MLRWSAEDPWNRFRGSFIFTNKRKKGIIVIKEHYLIKSEQLCLNNYEFSSMFRGFL